MKARFFQVVWVFSVLLLILIPVSGVLGNSSALGNALFLCGPLALLGLVVTYVFTGSFAMPRQSPRA